MPKPIIGITVSQHHKKSEGISNFNPAAYALAVSNTGGIPFLIPNEYPMDEIENLKDILAGILFSGGGDIDPTVYGYSLGNDSHAISQDRDRLEFALVRFAVDHNLPLLGICRGHQMLNVALGGTLITDISTQRLSPVEHDTGETGAKDILIHQVTIQPGTSLREILNANQLQVNSRHHQAVKDLAPGLTVTALASDGLIEGIELPGHLYCLGVQWHPENLQSYPEQQKIFSSFISAAAN